MRRRKFIQLVAATTAGGVLGGSSPGAVEAEVASRIDRRALVNRHKIVISQPDSLAPLSLGNGEMAFTADVTGLQTFPDFYQQGMPLHTMAQWAWHETPDSHNYKLADAMENYDFHGKQVPFPSNQASPAGGWLYANPHKFDLGRLAMILPSVNGHPAAIADLGNIHQELDLWDGMLTSSFTLNGQPVTVKTCIHPDRDIMAVQIASPLVTAGQVGLSMDFPGSPDYDDRNPGDWTHPETHTTDAQLHEGSADFTRQLQGTTLTYAQAVWPAGINCQKATQHRFEWRMNEAGQNLAETNLELVFAFSPNPSKGPLPSFANVQKKASAHWNQFWSSGGAVDLSESKDSRWMELERRIVLSQYQTAVNCAGSLPPQETGLVMNSWYGKFHLEMHWWHAAHFTLWGREDLLMKSLDFYRRILPVARETAARIGCRGARWPKMIGPTARESANAINPFLTWQQPHPIHYAELMYQAKPEAATLEFFRDIVFESAEFMASYAWWNESRKCFELGPPAVSAREYGFPSRAIAKNPCLDLVYWSWALGIAQKWRARLGLPPSPDWERVRTHFAPMPVLDGIYSEMETPVISLGGHPTMLASLGVTPDIGVVDHQLMQRTLDFVLSKWELGDTWGWDYPMMAMTACRLGRPDQAIQALFIEAQKNRFLPNGHNFQVLPVLPLYLPGNGGLLFAIAMMAAGWGGSPKGAHAPGFPTPDQGWTVKYEGLRPAL
jgi:hypothetical protein